MNIQKAMIFMLLVGMLLVACAPASLEPGTPVVGADVTAAAVVTPAATDTAAPAQPKNTAVDASIAQLAKTANINPSQVKIGTVEAVDWPNSCLGAANPDEMCADMITTGYRVVLEAGGKSYEYHTNQDGSEVRAVNAGVANPTPGGNLSPAEKAAQASLAKRMNAAPDAITVVRSEAVEWRDGCLGVALPGKMCTQVITPGYLVILEVGGKQYEYHTNKTGSTVIPADKALGASSQPTTSDQVIVWEHTENNVCSRVEIRPDKVAYGPCNGTLQETTLAAARLDELTYLLNAYQSFNQKTLAGQVELTGTGQQAATPAEMRSVAEWAKLVDMEAQGGRGGAAWGLAFTWHREGGIAGFCNDLAVYRTGWATPSSCKGGQLRAITPYRLTASELERMYAWLDQFKNFDYEQKDAATADAMVIRVSFMGTGTQQATSQQQQDIASYSSEVYTNAANK